MRLNIFIKESDGPIASTDAAEAKRLNNQKTKQFWLKTIRDLSDSNFLPTIVFIFSKNRINLISEIISDSVSLTTQEESAQADAFFRKAISHLKEVDRTLPQVIYPRYIYIK